MLSSCFVGQQRWADRQRETGRNRWAWKSQTESHRQKPINTKRQTGRNEQEETRPTGRHKTERQSYKVYVAAKIYSIAVMETAEDYHCCLQYCNYKVHLGILLFLDLLLTIQVARSNVLAPFAYLCYGL